MEKIEKLMKEKGCISVTFDNGRNLFVCPFVYLKEYLGIKDKPEVEKPKEELVCMKCGSKKNLNTNKDKSFVECDECMWDLKSKPEKQENCREKWIRHFKKIEHLLQLGAELGISKEIEDFLSELLKREKPILQMMSDKTFSKEELKVIEEWYDGMLYPTNPDERDKLVHDKLSKLLKEEK